MYYEEINLSDEVKSGLDKVIAAIDFDKNRVERNLYKPETTKEYAKYRTSEQVLNELMKNGSIDVATNDCNLLRFNNINFDFLGLKIAIEIKDRFSGYGLSGRIWYPENGYMGWHTNNDNKGHKLYCAFAREDKKSFFRYRHPETGEIITSWDNQGWNFRIFKVQENLLWHCVYSETDRFSIGYTLEKK